MKKSLIICLFLVLPILTKAQNRVVTEQSVSTQVSQNIEQQTKNAVKSPLPHRLSLYYSDLLWSGFHYPLIMANYLPSGNPYGAMVSFASFGINLDYQYVSKSERWSYGIDFGYAYINTRPLGSSYEPYSANFLSIMPMVTCYYIKRGIVRLYGSVSAGVLMLIDGDQSLARFSFQVNPIGIRVGSSRVAGFFALGVGSQGVCNLGLQVGF